MCSVSALVKIMNTNMDSRSINIVMATVNCKSLKTSAQQVRELCANADLVALQETWLLPHDLDFFHDFDSEFGCAARPPVDWVC